MKNSESQIKTSKLIFTNIVQNIENRISGVEDKVKKHRYLNQLKY